MRCIFLIFLIFPMLTHAVDVTDCRESQLTISGTVYYTSVYQGGMSTGDPDPVKYRLANYTMYLVSWTDENTIPTLVKNFTTDEQGNFSVALPAGKYGIVTQADLANLQPGQWLPEFVQSGDIAETYSCYWESSTLLPLDLTVTSVAGVSLIKHEQTTCGICP